MVILCKTVRRVFSLLGAYSGSLGLAILNVVLCLSYAPTDWSDGIRPVSASPSSHPTTLSTTTPSQHDYAADERMSIVNELINCEVTYDLIPLLVEEFKRALGISLHRCLSRSPVSRANLAMLVHILEGLE